MSIIYENETVNAKRDYVKEHGVRAYQELRHDAEAIVQRFGFLNGADVRRVADKYGRRVA